MFKGQFRDESCHTNAHLALAKYAPDDDPAWIAARLTLPNRPNRTRFVSRPLNRHWTAGRFREFFAVLFAIKRHLVEDHELCQSGLLVKLKTLLVPAVGDYSELVIDLVLNVNPNDPTPEEIAEECRAIRAEWSPEESVERSGMRPILDPYKYPRGTRVFKLHLRRKGGR